jgi:amidase
VTRADTPTDELWRWPASQIANAVRAKEISAEEATASCLTRIEAVNAKLNALVEVYPDEALAAARMADRMIAHGHALGPLHGVPTSIKVNSDERGHATTDGVVAFAEAIAENDSPQARVLRESGAIFLGRSNTPAFSFRWFASNDLHGTTHNPWDASRTPGGSTGGGAAAVASGMVPIAHGNDIGGSLRYPAYACGVVGLRPTAGRIPQLEGPSDGDIPLSGHLMSVQGPLARSIGDVRLALDAMGGYDPLDSVSVATVPVPPTPRRPLRVAMVAKNDVCSSTLPVDRALRNAAGWLEDAGYVVEEVELPLLEEAYRLWWLLCLEEFRLLMPLVNEVGDERIKTAAVHYYALAAEWWGSEPQLNDYIAGYARRGTLIRQLQLFLETYPVVLLPVSAEQAFEQDADIASPERMAELAAAQYSMMAIPALGFPGLSVPTGVVEGLPVGVQLLGRRYDESVLLDAGQAIELRAGTFTPIDPR